MSRDRSRSGGCHRASADNCLSAPEHREQCVARDRPVVPIDRTERIPICQRVHASTRIQVHLRNGDYWRRPTLPSSRATAQELRCTNSAPAPVVPPVHSFSTGSRTLAPRRKRQVQVRVHTRTLRAASGRGRCASFRLEGEQLPQEEDSEQSPPRVSPHGLPPTGRPRSASRRRAGTLADR